MVYLISNEAALHHCLTDIVLDKTIASTDGVGALCGKSAVIP